MLAFGPSFFTLGVALFLLTDVQTLPSVSPAPGRQTTTTDGRTRDNSSIPEMSTTAKYNGSNTSTTSMNYANSSTTIMTWTELTSDGPDPTRTTVSHSLTTKMKDNQKDKLTTAKPFTRKSYDSTGIIVLVLIIIIAMGFSLACCIARRRQRRYSVDFHSRPDEANVPLSTVEPEVAVASASHNGLQTFQSDRKSAKDGGEEQEEPDGPKTEAVDSQQQQADSASTTQPADDSENKPKDDVDAEKGLGTPEEQAKDHVTDPSLDGTPKETNENNSNNTCENPRKANSQLSSFFWEVSLDSQL
ncbi:uncharacterized protein si:dkey-27h10.2 [Nerophis ophidion]|uniref:uncharacterized protein si:dkey-27h10.2 n=1 Tax=Nerophis ophidion TaxID=159077 RepID=UPI002AE097C5|nr:uncharacterized protein si:dkey-27h10.2 [Nerophis ophidion]XP_061737187.1 uncharacterized protein si:dkey-27h10.2 [Nerophis ophidion]